MTSRSQRDAAAPRRRRTHHGRGDDQQDDQRAAGAPGGVGDRSSRTTRISSCRSLDRRADARRTAAAPRSVTSACAGAAVPSLGRRRSTGSATAARHARGQLARPCPSCGRISGWSASSVRPSAAISSRSVGEPRVYGPRSARLPLTAYPRIAGLLVDQRGQQRLGVGAQRAGLVQQGVELGAVLRGDRGRAGGEQRQHHADDDAERGDPLAQAPAAGGRSSPATAPS